MSNQPTFENLTDELFLVSRKQKEALNKQKAFVVWLTGLSGSGKSTIARNLEVLLHEAGIRTLILDGDNTRRSINSDLDFSAAGRKENIRRVSEMAKLLNDAGVVVITAFISPFADDRQLAKEIIGNDCFIEIFVDTSLECCIARDAKGLYKKALNGDLEDFTGISSPYEIPKTPHLRLLPENQKPIETAQIVFSCLQSTIISDKK